MTSDATQRTHRAALGDRIRELRGERGLSQEQLAHIAGLDRTYVSGVERGQRNIGLDNIHRIAAAPGVSARELF